MDCPVHHVGCFKGNDEEDEWLRLALCFWHQKYQKKNKTRVFFLCEANIDETNNMNCTSLAHCAVQL
jgi:hypothetical protein